MGKLSATLPPFKVKKQFQSFSEVYDWGLRDIHIPEAHKHTLGEGIKIAVVDSGKSEHSEVADAILGAKNFSDSPQIEDRNGHSTFCSGIIAARQNSDGIIGVAPKAQLYFSKATGDSGSGSPSALVNGIQWAIQQGVDIISISAGMFFDFKPLHQIVKKAYQRNIIIVAAAGNSGGRYYDIAFPARYPEVIGVAAYDQRRQVAPFSSRGINVDFAFPGVDIYSTYLNNGYAKMNGTSFSCPIMAGVCALILARHRQVPCTTPCETPAQMMEHLKKYAKKLGSQNETGFGVVELDTMFSS
jgi:subtilisin family serine protease